jgi:2-keto-4-pentenoate hydratase/2-oxohepta-3-ene-1,7-dioic acid hydratase in catechol pathway
MKFARVRSEQGPRWAIVEGSELLLLDGDPISGEWEATTERVAYDESALLLPLTGTTKIAAIGKNYADHVAEMATEVPPEMQIFLKPTTSLIGPGEEVVRPAVSERVDFEGEIAVVIGKRAKDVRAVDAADYIFGYTVANDVTARDIQIADVQWTRAKSYDTFCPVGPVVETAFDPETSSICTRVNGQVRQSSPTSMLLNKVPTIIEFISAAFTLLPGDIVLTGTPAGVGPLSGGDVVSVEVDGIGTLRNPVR